MSLTNRKPRPLDRKVASRDARLFVIATEDTHAPKQYFDLEHFKHRRVQIVVLETTDSKSAPNHVLERLKRYEEQFDLQEDDELWLAIDTDRWPEGLLSQVATEARQKGFKFAVSRHCFDLWLLLHFMEFDSEQHSEIKGDGITSLLRATLGGFNKANVSALPFDEPKILQAIQRARALDLKPADFWPQTPGSRVYLLVEALRAFRRVE